MPIDKSTRRWYLVAPPLYVVVIAALLYLQFGGRTSVRETVGSLEVGLATQRDMFGRDRLRTLDVRYGPLRLAFSASSLEDASGTTERLGPTEYRISSAGLLVILGDRVELVIQADEARMSILATAIGAIPAAVSLSLPLAFDTHASASATRGLPLLRIVEPGCTLYLSAPDGALVDQRRVTAPLAAGSQIPLLTAERCSEVVDPYRYWFGQVGVPGDAVPYGSLVEGYLAACFATWRTELSLGGVDVLSQDALVTAYLCEALAQGALVQAVTDLQGRTAAALSQGGQAASAAPGTFLGMLPAYLAGSHARAAAVIRELTRKIGASDPDSFAVPRLLATLLDHGSMSLVEQLLDLGASVSVGSGSPEVLLGLARFYADLEATIRRTDDVGRRLEQIVVERLLPSLRRTERGVFFLPSPQTGEDLERTLVTGRLLVDASALLGREPLAFVGRQCILSALSLAALDGSLPAGIRLEEARLVPSPELLPPESVYALIADARYVPVERPLHAEVGAGVSLLSAARVTALAFERGTLRMTLVFPVSQTHYLALEGVPGVAQLQMHGLTWRADPEYYRYTDGWWYEADTQTLYLKCTHQRESEELVVTFP